MTPAALPKIDSSRYRSISRTWEILYSIGPLYLIFAGCLRLELSVQLSSLAGWVEAIVGLILLGCLNQTAFRAITLFVFSFFWGSIFIALFIGRTSCMCLKDIGLPPIISLMIDVLIAGLAIHSLRIAYPKIVLILIIVIGLITGGVAGNNYYTEYTSKPPSSLTDMGVSRAKIEMSSDVTYVVAFIRPGCSECSKTVLRTKVQALRLAFNGIKARIASVAVLDHEDDTPIEGLPVIGTIRWPNSMKITKPYIAIIKNNKITATIP